MKIREGITGAGTWIADYTKVVSEFPTEGSCTVIESERVNNGGAPYNVLIDLRRLGAPFTLRAIGCVGRDVDGANILKDCLAHQIDSNGMRIISEASTSFSDVMASAPTGVRTSFNHPGANALLGSEHFDFASDASKIFFLGTIFFMGALDAEDSKFGTKAGRLLRSARKAGMVTCVDIERCNHVTEAVFKKGSVSALKQSELIIVNVEVCERLTGIRVRQSTGVDFDAAVDAARALLRVGDGRCVVIRFPSGAVAVQSDGTVTVEGSVKLPKSRIVNACGTGHAFTAGFLYCYHADCSLSECLKAAHATAATCLMDSSASNGIRKLSSCLALLERFGQRAQNQPPVQRRL